MRYTIQHCGESIYVDDADSESALLDAYAVAQGYDTYAAMVEAAMPWSTVEEARSELQITCEQ